jgi:hypothetical protein
LGSADLRHRLLRGGLPPFFQRLVELLLAQSGGIFDATALARACGEFDPTHLRAFRNRYPAGVNFLVSADVEMARTRRFGELTVEVVALADLLERLITPRPPRRRRRG